MSEKQFICRDKVHLLQNGSVFPRQTLQGRNGEQHQKPICLSDSDRYYLLMQSFVIALEITAAISPSNW